MFSVVRASVCVSAIVRFPTCLTAMTPYFQGTPVHTQRPSFTFLATRIGAKHEFFVQVDIWSCLYFFSIGKRLTIGVRFGQKILAQTRPSV